MKIFTWLVLGWFGAGCCAPAAVHGADAQTFVAAPSGPGLESLVREFQADSQAVSRFFDLPWSAARFDRLEKLYRGWQERLAAVKFESLDQPGRIDYLLLRGRLAADLDELGLERGRLAEMEELIAWRAPIQELERLRWRMEPLKPEPAAEAVARVPAQIKLLRKRLEQGRKHDPDKEKATGDASHGSSTNTASGAAPAAERDPAAAAEEVVPLKVTPLLAKRAAGAVDDLRGTLKTWYAFYDGYQPDFGWWLKKPYEETSQALEEYSKFLREELAGIKGKDEDPLLGEPIGADLLAKALAAEMLPYSAQELIAIGEREFAWCEGEMKKAAAEMGCGEDWQRALSKVKADYVPPGSQDDLVATCGREAIQFVKAHSLVTVPPLCEETWRITMLSPEGQKTLPYAAYGGQGMLVAYAKDEMKQEDKLMAMRGNNRHFTRIVVPHELIPGHHLQSFQAARNSPYRAAFSTPFFVEGWALYWELTLWDQGYARTPEDRIGMLFWRMHRGARIVVSLKFHLGQMKPQEMVDFLVKRVGHEKLGATSEVRRFIGSGYSPQYQCGYLIGGLQLRALHRELTGPGKLSDLQFNDSVLRYGPIPIELIRAGLLNTPLTPDTRAAWKFADDQPPK